ncbi:hypothetical protein IMPR6_60210 [Imperialibacter sp. EC-SDR9]|nr:hypothetical protein IMPERIA89_230075 [Imperialibacter sp. 89]CAD5262075.1 hypothetical protein IMPERIA75_280075 [Imperialibacter sp. 75]VVT33051.1 hypothetical protein IMPR6_60210 [Imperialibacter sp. EC-SDR9]
MTESGDNWKWGKVEEVDYKNRRKIFLASFAGLSKEKGKPIASLSRHKP